MLRKFHRFICYTMALLTLLFGVGVENAKAASLMENISTNQETVDTDFLQSDCEQQESSLMEMPGIHGISVISGLVKRSNSRSEIKHSEDTYCDGNNTDSFCHSQLAQNFSFFSKSSGEVGVLNYIHNQDGKK